MNRLPDPRRAVHCNPVLSPACLELQRRRFHRAAVLIGCAFALGTALGLLAGGAL